MFLVPTGTKIKCVLKSQLLRLLAYLLDFIQDEDTILTADVDAFPMNFDLFKPLTEKNYQIWIYRYALTLGNPQLQNLQ